MGAPVARTRVWREVSSVLSKQVGWRGGKRESRTLVTVFITASYNKTRVLELFVFLPHLIIYIRSICIYIYMLRMKFDAAESCTECVHQENLLEI